MTGPLRTRCGEGPIRDWQDPESGPTRIRYRAPSADASPSVPTLHQQATMRFSLAALAAASALTFHAQADASDRGVHNAPEVGLVRTAIGSVEVGQLFASCEPTALFTTSVVCQQPPMLVTGSGVLALHGQAGAADIAIGSLALDGTAGNPTQAFGALDRGGGDAEMLGGLSTFGSTDTPDSDPENYTLMLAGLSIVGFLTLRRHAGTESR